MNTNTHLSAIKLAFAAAIACTAVPSLASNRMPMNSFAGSTMPVAPLRGYPAPMPRPSYIAPQTAPMPQRGFQVYPGGAVGMAMTPYPMQMYRQVPISPRAQVNPTETRLYKILDPIDRTAGKIGPIVGRKLMNCAVNGAGMGSMPTDPRARAVGTVVGCATGLAQ